MSDSRVTCSTSKIIFHDYSDLNWTDTQPKLFKIRISDYKDDINVLISFLSQKEQVKSERYYLKKDSYRFIISRAALKFLLAKQTGFAIHDIILKNDENKKPYLPLDLSVFFNISHSKDCILIAIGRAPVGVDIEKIDKTFNFSSIIHRVLNEKEINHLNASKNQLSSFYTFWTRKEAIVKATGKGIDDAFIKIPSMDGTHLIESELSDAFNKMQVQSFTIDTDYIGAIALTKDFYINAPIPCYKIQSIMRLQ